MEPSLNSMEKTLHRDEKVEFTLRTTAELTINTSYKQKDSETNEKSSSSDADCEVEVKGIDSEVPHTAELVEGIIDSQGHDPNELADIYPFLHMAMAAYSDKSMADEFPNFVTRSHLITNLKERTVLNKDQTIRTDTEVHVCLMEDGSLAFAFRGTEFQFQDWQSLFADLMTDVMKAQTPVELYDASDNVAYRGEPSIKAHYGFQLAFRDITKTPRPNENIRLVAEGLGARTRDVRRVICIGHSLGGALATLCATWCRYVAYPSAEVWCVTMGSPRVGNEAFAHDFNNNVVTKGRSYRVVNKGDVVPNVPHFDNVINVLCMYKHVDGLIYLSEHPTSKGTIIIKRGGHRPGLYMLSMTDHHRSSYRESVSRVLAALSPHHCRLSLPLLPESR